MKKTVQNKIKQFAGMAVFAMWAGFYFAVIVIGVYGIMF